MTERPPLSTDLGEADFCRWYWTMAELQPFARANGIPASGPKAALMEHIAAFLGGRAAAVSPRRQKAKHQLAGPLALDTIIPTGQRSTTTLREFFVAQIGPQFRFDGHMRSFLSGSDGSTLADAIAHWHATRGTDLPPQSKSLEFNAFTKAWHRSHPDGSNGECRAAWGRYRSLPTDKRPPVAEA